MTPYLFFLVIVPSAFLSAIWSGYVLSVLWAWFVVPAFGLKAISISMAIGLTTVAKMLTYMPNIADGQQGPDHASGVAYAIVMPALALLVGWIAKQFL